MFFFWFFLAKPEQTENTALLTEEITNENDLCSTTANLAFPCHSSFETPPPPIDIAMNGNQLEKSIDALPSKIKGHNSVLSYCTLAHHKPITLPEVLSVSKPPHSLGYSCLNKYQPVPQVSNVVLDQTQQDIANTVWIFHKTRWVEFAFFYRLSYLFLFLYIKCWFFF